MRRRERGGVRSVVGPGLVAVSLGVVAVAALLSPGEPVQHAMAQTNPAPAAKPLLDTSGIAEIQTIPVGKSRLYELRETIEWFIEEETRHIEWGRRTITTVAKFREYLGEYYTLPTHMVEKLVALYGSNLAAYWDWQYERVESWKKEPPMETILESLGNLALLQMGLAGQVDFSVYHEEAPLPHATFGWVLQEILGIDPARDFGLTVEHTDFVQTALRKKDSYKLIINYRDIFLTLRDSGNPEEGDRWYIEGLVLAQDSEKRDVRGRIYTERKELMIHRLEDRQNPGKYKFMALYTVMTLAPDGTIVAREEWEFAQGNPKAVSYRRH